MFAPVQVAGDVNPQVFDCIQFFKFDSLLPLGRRSHPWLFMATHNNMLLHLEAELLIQLEYAVMKNEKKPHHFFEKMWRWTMIFIPVALGLALVWLNQRET